MKQFCLCCLIFAAAIFFPLSYLSAAEPTGKIQSLEVTDAPYDDGAGVMLSWKPLPKHMRIIEYRIYRGVSPDTLFLLSQVEVDATAGVVADRMYFYDKDFQMLLTIDSPAKLKKEKQQHAKSPLYNKVPRDPQILNQLFPHFTLLGIVDQSNLYKHAQKITAKDGTVAAGLTPIQFEQIAANPISGQRYYYTVLAVNEKGTFLPYANIKSAIPYDNPPDTTAVVSSVYLTDTATFQFEWTSSTSSYDIAQYQIWLLPKNMLPAFNQWQNVYQEQNGIQAPWTKNAILIAEKLFYYNNYLIVHTKNGRVINPDGSAGNVLPLERLNDYECVLASQDYSGMTSYSLGNPLRFLKEKDLPKKPVFSVTDKPDDKGDTNAISFGKPISYITQAAFTNAKHNKIRINYEISENLNYKVDGLRFRFYDEKTNKLMAQINEPYPDKIITLKLPAGVPNLNNLLVKIAFRYRGTKQFTDYYVEQRLQYDDTTKRFMSKDIYYHGDDLSFYFYQIFRKNLLEDAYYPSKKISCIARNYDDIVNFETTLQKLITGVDVKSGCLLLSPTLNFAIDEKTGMPLSVNIFRDQQMKEVNDLKAEIASLNKQLKSNPAKADSLQGLITEKQTYLNALLANPIYKKSLSISDPQKWLAFIHNEYLKLSRSYSYLIMKTDNDAAYVFSEESKSFLPISNWFNRQFLLALIASVIFTGIVLYTSHRARRGKDLYLRPIAGLQEIDNAVGRATEMGRPILYVPGWSTIGEITTIASMMILNRVARKAAEYDTRILVPNSDYYVMPLAQEMVRDAFYEAGRPDSYNQVDVFYVSSDQFPYAAGVNGTMIREKAATNFFMGFFNAEALLMTETGNAIGSIQIAGTDAITQVPFFITTCDYTLIGEEFYAASAYLSKDPELVSMLKAQDYFKFLIVFFILLGAILSTLHFNWLTNAFPIE